MFRQSHPRVLGPLVGLAMGGVLGAATVSRGALGRGDATVQTRLAALEALTQHLIVVHGPLNGLAGPHLILEGVNLHLRNGTGATDQINGLGNLIVGYNERPDPPTAGDRNGSHTVVIGPEHRYLAAGGLIAGRANTVNGQGASVSGGRFNIASEKFASVSGGTFNTAGGFGASVSGGTFNTAGGFGASVSGGQSNTVTGSFASVSGGATNTASGSFASVSGGVTNTASGIAASISGGHVNTASGTDASVSGGNNLTAGTTFCWRAKNLNQGC